VNKKYLFFFVVLIAACTSGKNEPLNVGDGLYFVTDSINPAWTKINEFKIFDSTQVWSIDTSRILSTKNLAMQMNYDSMMYADTFAEIATTLSPEIRKTWDERTLIAREKKVALVMNNKIIQWMVLPSIGSFVPGFKFCYCDYSKSELKEIEKLIKIN
jgi:hypothetical protein